MTKEQATKIVNLISFISKAEAAIAINIFCENAFNADNNRKIAERAKQELIDYLSALTEQHVSK